MTPPLFVPALGRSLYPGASVALDFTRNLYRSGTPVVKGSPSLLPGWTFTRASTGYAETVAGTLTSFASGAPRITDKGLLVEEARTNLLLRSQEFSTSWNKTGVTITDNDTAAPDGTLTADRVTSTGSVILYQVVVLNATSCAFSIYVKQGSGATEANAFLLANQTRAANLILGSLNYSTGAWTGDAGVTVTALANGWWRLTMVATSGITSGDSIALYTAFVGYPTSGQYAYLWGAQLEAGSFPTSYIPTTTAAATRAADDAVITGLSVLDGCTFVQRALAPAGVSADARMSSLNDGSSNNQFRLNYSGTTLSVLQVIAGSVATAQTGTAAAGATLNSAANSLGANMRASVNGGAVGAAAVGGSMPTLTRLDIGKSAASSLRYWNNYIRQIIIYPTAFTDAQLIAASA